MIRTFGSVALLQSLSLPLAAETGLRLLLFDAEDCPFCEQWRDEVGVVYAKTAEGKRAPLEHTPLEAGLPAGITLREPVRYTPTFVLLDRRGRELGRITGYPGEDHFWGLLEQLIRRVDGT